jgi:hypothetical protein
MKYDEYKKQYERHTELIEQFDGRIATNEKKQLANASALTTAESEQAALTAGKEPENVDVDKLEAADADVQKLRDDRTGLLEEWSELEAGRSEVNNSREELKVDNPDLEAQRFSDSIPAPEGERGVGNAGKGFAVLLAANVAAAETAEIRAENLETIQTISAQQHEASGDALNPGAQPQAPQHDQHDESERKRLHVGDDIAEDEYDHEDRRAQTTELVMSDPPGDGTKPGSAFVPPMSGSVTVSASDGAPSQMATPRPPQPDDTVTTQTYQVNGQAATFGTGGVAPPNEDFGPPSNGSKPDAKPLSGPNDQAPSPATPSQQDQKLLTYDEPKLLTHQPAPGPLAGPSEQPIASTSAPPTSSLQGPDESMPAAAPADSGPPQDQNISM